MAVKQYRFALLSGLSGRLYMHLRWVPPPPIGPPPIPLSSPPCSPVSSPVSSPLPSPVSSPRASPLASSRASPRLMPLLGSLPHASLQNDPAPVDAQLPICKLREFWAEDAIDGLVLHHARPKSARALRRVDLSRGRIPLAMMQQVCVVGGGAEGREGEGGGGSGGGTNTSTPAPNP